jgi:cell wall assembly regulator SMI1
MESINQALDRLLNYWEKQKIGSSGKSLQDIAKIEKQLNVKLPQDFITYFNVVNGMGNSHLNDTDERGFSFYQLEDLTLFHGNVEYKSNVLKDGRKFILPTDYLV